MTHSHSNRRFAISLAIGWTAAAACASTAPPADPVETPPAPTTQVAVPHLRQLTVPTGSTNVDARRGIRYELEGLDRAGAVALVPAIQASVAYYRQDGSRIPANVVLDAAPADRVDPVKGVVPALATALGLAITPATDLDRDTWYALRFAPASAYAVKPLDSVRGSIDVVLFTGSAPMVRYVFGTTDDKGHGQDRYLMVFLSEPVKAGSLAGDAVSWSSDRGRAAGCVYREGRCISSDATTMIGAFQYNFSSPLATVQDIAELHVAGTVRGAARSVAEALRPGASAGLRYAWGPADWVPCNGNAATVCWTPSLPL